MTGAERSDLRLALDILRDWRKDDAAWKEDIAKRMGVLEDRFVALDAIAQAEKDKRSLTLARDQRTALWLSLIGGGAGAIVYALANGIFA